MKIIFITGPIIPQKCGITDHINKLTTELVRLGHDVKICEFKKFIKFSPSFVENFNADVYSIQFSPFAFSSSGLCKNKLIKLAQLLKNKVSHVNFHEIWIGDYINAKLMEKIRGCRQKKEILLFLKLLAPKSITTTNSASLFRLRKEGVHTSYLYLFGNFPAVPSSNEPDTHLLKIAVFGTPYKKFPYHDLFQKVSEISTQLGRRCHIKIIGLQRDTKGLMQLIKTANKFSFIIEKTGKLSNQEVSKHIKNCNLGISTTPYDTMGKSSATAAILEQGTPIITHDDGDTPQQALFLLENFQNRVFLLNDGTKYDKELIQLINKHDKLFFNGVSYTANQFIDLIS